MKSRQLPGAHRHGELGVREGPLPGGAGRRRQHARLRHGPYGLPDLRKRRQPLKSHHAAIGLHFCAVGDPPLPSAPLQASIIKDYAATRACTPLELHAVAVTRDVQ